MRELLLYPRAFDDIAAAVQWYEARREGLGREFESVLEAALERIRRSPEAFPLVTGPYRRVVLRRFPYQVYFRSDPHSVWVALVFHTSKNPAAANDALGESRQ